MDQHAAWTKHVAAKKAAAGTAGNESSGNDERLLSQRLVHVPTSLPPSVASQLAHIDRTYIWGTSCWSYEDWLRNFGEQYLARESWQLKLQLLKDVQRLCQLLLTEVPCTIGCSNPACLDLRGASEIKVSSKACTGCKVVHYCSRQCQVAHWKAHRGIWKKLSGSNPGRSEAVKGGGKQQAGEEVTCTD